MKNRNMNNESKQNGLHRIKDNEKTERKQSENGVDERTKMGMGMGVGMGIGMRTRRMRMGVSCLLFVIDSLRVAFIDRVPMW